MERTACWFFWAWKFESMNNPKCIIPYQHAISLLTGNLRSSKSSLVKILFQNLSVRTEVTQFSVAWHKTTNKGPRLRMLTSKSCKHCARPIRDTFLPEFVERTITEILTGRAKWENCRSTVPWPSRAQAPSSPFRNRIRWVLAKLKDWRLAILSTVSFGRACAF